LIKLTKPVIGWISYDFANSAFATIVLAVIFNRYFALVVAGGQEGVTLSLPWGYITIPGASMWAFLVAISTAVVVVLSPFFGAMADQAGLRKRLLVTCCYIGVAATITLSIIGEGDILTGSIIFMIANFGFAAGNVFYNAFLLDVSKRETFGKVSGLAWGLGYLGGGLCLILNLIMLERPQLLGFPEGAFDVGDCMIVAGVWWGLFALPTCIWLKDRDRPERKPSLIEMTIAGCKRLGRTFSEIRRYRQLIRFLIAYLLFNDGIETVIIMASIFGAIEVGMSAGAIVGFFIMVQAAALSGAFLFGWIADWFGNRNTLLVTLVIWFGVVVWAFFLGWFTDTKTEFYIIGVLAGMAMGGSQTTARALQASFTPRDQSAEFFGFWAISGRFASIFGPLIYGAAILATGGVRSGILALGLFFIAGGVVLWCVDEVEGVQAAVDTSNSNNS